MSFERTWTVRFSDSDPFGIAHYPRIIDAVHETSDMFMVEIGHPFWELSQDRGFGLPIVEVDFEFKAPVEAGNEVTIALTPEVGDKSIRFDYTAICDGTVTFEGYEQRVCAEHGGGGAIEVPDELRDAMASYAEG
ncbi:MULTISPECIES: acyl-CoA thioesterase [Halorubrum]|uniref:Thioesterase n=1 Tax=Halorubrum tropicale TaxID=1765655 RepID=A0A0M9AQ61_9EURY|nr:MULTISPECIES: acyl-CoA thioesterase [Halorubrum]KOX95445.1 thioesterase [Halorubrum tropicale]MDB2239000.1 acyl-CoA thioesterase [Halorubrum ezzemoulense]MDB2249737.1 acyl-CoA thioesterase [Halorubrum ezzemoulense]